MTNLLFPPKFLSFCSLYFPPVSEFCRLPLIVFSHVPFITSLTLFDVVPPLFLRDSCKCKSMSFCVKSVVSPSESYFTLVLCVTPPSPLLRTSSFTFLCVSSCHQSLCLCFLPAFSFVCPRLCTSFLACFISRTFVIKLINLS